MRKFILQILLLLSTVTVNAATYYFSSGSGDDSRTSSQAQNSSTPWKTLSKLNSIMSTLKAGDQVLFNRGESFDGSIIPTVSGTSSTPIYFGAYGSGNKPIINGFSYLAGWQQVNGNIWECGFWQPTGIERMVIKNGKQAAIGRYPNRSASNGGYLTIDSHVGLTQLTSSQLPASPNWTGADIVIRKNRWVLDRSTVSYHSGTTIGFASGSSNSITDKFGFFLENSPSTLDQDGEWWYDKSRAKMQMYFADNNPNSYTLRGSTVDILVTISFQKYITFENLNFRGANQYTFKLTNSDYIKINNCNINFSGIEAVNGLSSGNFTLSNSTVNDANNNGINMNWNCNNATITNNVFSRTANILGMNQSDANTFQGISILGNNNLIQYNEFDSTGSSAVHFEGDYSTVANNYINTFGFLMDDCGGIYTGQGLGDNTVYNSKSITNNIIINGIGNTDGTNDKTYIAVQGIYLDENTNHVSVTGNTVANCGQAGIFHHNANNTTIANNTFFNNGKEQMLIVRTSNPVSNINANGNISFSKTASQLCSRIESYYGTNNLSALGTIDGNYYCRPLDNNYIFYDMYLSGGQYYTSYDNMTSWRSKFGFDKNSKGAPALIPAYKINSTSGVNLYTNGSYNSNADNVGTYATNGSVTKSWVSGKLDGGTMQIVSTSNSSNNIVMLTMPLNKGVVAGQSYQLNFSMQGSASNSPLTVYLRQNASPQIDLTARTQFPVTTSRQNLQLIFTATTSSSSGALEFDIAAPNGTVWIDNVSLQEASVTPTNPDEYILFQTNPSTSTKTISLSGSYYDAKGIIYSGSVTIPAYGSVVLFKTAGTTVASSAKSAESISLNAEMVDASAASVTGNSTAEVNWTTDNQSEEVACYQVERSSDNNVFIPIGKVMAKPSSSSVNYQFNDATPAAGKNYYRITEFDAKDTKINKLVTVVNNISFHVNPNPAKDVIHLMFDYPVSTSDNVFRQTSIRDMSGVTVKSVQLPVTNSLSQADITVSELKPGTYVLTILSEGKSMSRKFIKQ